MRLSIEQAKKYLQGMHRLWLCDEWEQSYDSERCKYCDSHDDCLDIVLAQAAALSDIAQDLYDTFEAMQHENEQLKADIRGKDNEINDLKAIIEYLRKFKPKKNEAVREGRMMERLTYRDENGKAWANIKNNYTAREAQEFGRIALEQLAAYEDSGLSPEEVQKLKKSDASKEQCTIDQHGEIHRLRDELKRYKQAEQEGRLVELPVKVGDNVYFLLQELDGEWYVSSPHLEDVIKTINEVRAQVRTKASEG